MVKTRSMELEPEPEPELGSNFVEQEEKEQDESMDAKDGEISDSDGSQNEKSQTEMDADKIYINIAQQVYAEYIAIKSCDSQVSHLKCMLRNKNQLSACLELIDESFFRDSINNITFNVSRKSAANV